MSRSPDVRRPELSCPTHTLSKYVSNTCMFRRSAYRAAALAASAPYTVAARLAAASSRSFATSAFSTTSRCFSSSSARRLSSGSISSCGLPRTLLLSMSFRFHTGNLI